MTTPWLDRTQEATLEPEFEICDPHHHLWDYPDSRYLLDEILEDADSGHNVVKTVFVECSSMYRAEGPSELAPVGETEFVNGIAAMSASGNYGSIRVADGIVGYADLQLGTEVEPVLSAHMAASPRFKGIRHAAGWHESTEIRNSHTNPEPHLLMDAKFREGFAVLGKLGLSFDAWFYHHQLPEFIDLAKTFPDVTIILDHFGGPLGIGPYANQQDKVFDEWRDRITELRDCTNVFFKLGGINMKINGFDWHRQESPPSSDDLLNSTGHYYLHCIETFGARRCMFESNFPVDKASCSYNVLWNTFKKMTRRFDAADRRALFHDTAVTAYRL